MLILKHLKTLQHVSIIIMIIIRDFVGSLLKSLNLKFNRVASLVAVVRDRVTDWISGGQPSKLRL